MMKCIVRWFRKKNKKETYAAFLLQAILSQYPLVSHIDDEQLLEVNQRLTRALRDNENICVRAGGESGMDNEFVRRHHYVANQLQELIDLRKEIKEIYTRLEYLSKNHDL